jgi:hypothetical protein
MPEQISEPTIVPISPVVARVMSQDAGEVDVARSARGQDPATEHNGGAKTSRDVENDTAAPRQSGSQPQDGQQPLRVSDIRVGNKDGRGLPITHIYAAQSDEYSIYQAGEVMVQFADDIPKAQTQRKSILAVSSARAEVNALAQGLACREICDRQLAYALQLALDGEMEGAKATVAAAKNFILAKRAARGRFQYLKWSFGAAAVLIGLLFVAGRSYPLHDTSSDLWLAGKAGLIGAAFSIALAIRNRTVALDTELLDNVTDGTLRLLIGVISAGVLLLLLGCGILPSLKIGEANFSASSLTWQLVLVIGFLGGFLERLVPDLLEKKNPQGNGSNQTTVAVSPR